MSALSRRWPNPTHCTKWCYPDEGKTKKERPRWRRKWKQISIPRWRAKWTPRWRCWPSIVGGEERVSVRILLIQSRHFNHIMGLCQKLRIMVDVWHLGLGPSWKQQRSKCWSMCALHVCFAHVCALHLFRQSLNMPPHRQHWLVNNNNWQVPIDQKRWLITWHSYRWHVRELSWFSFLMILQHFYTGRVIQVIIWCKKAFAWLAFINWMWNLFFVLLSGFLFASFLFLLLIVTLSLIETIMLCI